MTRTTVKCPTCGRPLEWSEASPFRPFCSERCKLIDFGGWLSEQRGIPDDKSPPEPEDPSHAEGSSER
ncbi:MAG TPA: DNA gyrase inhibitor YacG [Steroidobacteraceae bacterium]|nr:DNA gyrase inhibitor YacG [Steroidobacteraceae bacterium]